jgi:hypothetical protein
MELNVVLIQVGFHITIELSLGLVPLPQVVDREQDDTGLVVVSVLLERMPEVTMYSGIYLNRRDHEPIIPTEQFTDIISRPSPLSSRGMIFNGYGEPPTLTTGSAVVALGSLLLTTLIEPTLLNVSGLTVRTSNHEGSSCPL